MPPGIDTTRGDVVKYMLLIYQNTAAAAAMSEEEMGAMQNEAGDIWQELTKSGEWVSGAGLAGPAQAKAIRVRDGVAAVTDGPFSEAKEQLAGICIFEVESPERAVEIAQRWPDARHWGVELREIVGVAEA
jgi:hypothetical protein